MRELLLPGNNRMQTIVGLQFGVTFRWDNVGVTSANIQQWLSSEQRH